MESGAGEKKDDRNRVAALIPAFEEASHISAVVEGARRYLETVVVIDDGSHDATGALAKAAGAEVITHPRNLGKGAAIKTGLNALLPRCFDYLLLMDGDGQHLCEEIDRFLEAARAQPDIPLWIGNRMDNPVAMPLPRLLANRFMSWRISAMCGTKVPDSQCGFRMLHRCIIPSLFCETNAFDYETEMLLVARRKGYPIGSVPVTAIYGDEKSKIRPVHEGWRFLKLMARYRCKKP